MTTFRLRVLDSEGQHEFADVISFVGEDASGSFGILAGHARTITSLVTGLARFRTASSDWRYIAMPGAILYFDENVLSLCTRRCLIGDDYERISSALREQLLAEESKLVSMKQSLHRMEEEVFKRLWELSKEGAWKGAQGP
jgi:F-type H+-transporting ATPase subunit epsilon